MEIVEITTDFIKLDSLLKFSGITETGGQAKEIISSGIVFVNDEVCLMRGKKIKDGDIITIDDISFSVKKI